MGGLSIEKLEIGMSSNFSKTITECDIYGFAGITGDFNPAHINQEYAGQSKFGGRIAHGMLSAGLISTVIGMQLPGPGTIYLNQTLKFMAPVYIGDTITATVKVSELLPQKKQVILETVCINQNGKKIIEGTALVMPPA